MGCNASNHPPHCNCGFGGYQGYSPKNTTGREVRRNLQYTYDQHNEYYIYRDQLGVSFTTFVKCRYCSQYIYLYKSPYGNWVLFNELGPPWEKHECSEFERHASPECDFVDIGYASIPKKNWHLVTKIEYGSEGIITLDSETTWAHLKLDKKIDGFDERSPIFFKFSDIGDSAVVSGLVSDDLFTCREEKVSVPTLQSVIKQRSKKRQNKVSRGNKGDNVFNKLNYILDLAEKSETETETSICNNRFINLIKHLNLDYNKTRVNFLKNRYHRIFKK